MRRNAFCTVILLLLFSLPGGGQDFSGLLSGAKDLLKNVSSWGPIHFLSDYDSTYFDYPEQKWSVKLTTNLHGAGMSIKSRGEEPATLFHSRISSKSKLSHTITVGYKSFALSYTFDPYGSKSSDSRLGFTLYGNPICIDLTYHKIYSFSGHSTIESGRRIDIPYGGPSMKLLNINAFYVFNHRHYSFPACVDQTYVQHKSSGSAIVGISYANNRTSIPDLGIESASLSVNAKLLSLGAGYGYTLMPGGRWQIMLMAMPKLVFYDSSSLKNENYSIYRTFTRPQFMFTGHAAAVHWFGRNYLALTSAVEGYRVGNISGFKLFQYQWSLRLHYGILF